MARSTVPAAVPLTARSAQVIAGPGRPDRTIQLVRDVAARAPTSRSVCGSWACHAASKRPSALGDPVYTPRSPVRASRRALGAWQDARTRAAAGEAAAL